MPPKKKKAFAEKEKAVKFNLVHRSQHDPLIADEEATPFVLQRVETKREVARRNRKERSGEDGRGQRRPAKVRYGERETDDYGNPLDGYDYQQHMRPMGGGKFVPAVEARSKSSLTSAAPVGLRTALPGDVFATVEETRVGMLNRAAPTGFNPNLDPDVIDVLVALEEAELADPGADEAPIAATQGIGDMEDDFFTAMQEAEDQMGSEDDQDDLDSNGERDYDTDDLDSTGAAFSSDDEREAGRAPSVAASRRSARSRRLEDRFDIYSMASTIRQGHAGVLDERVELAAESEAWDDDQIGELDEADPAVRGSASLDQFAHVLDAFLEEQKKIPAGDLLQFNRDFEDAGEDSDEAIEAGERELDQLLKPRKREQWDVETIVSTFTNTENHPHLIKEPPKPAKGIKLSRKSGIPLGVLDGNGRGDDAAADGSDGDGDDDDEYEDVVNKGEKRANNETPEEKRARKEAVKAERRAARERKKTVKQAFKAEEGRQKAIKKKAGREIRLA